MGRKGRREEDRKAEGAHKWSLRRGGEKKHLGHTKQLGENSPTETCKTSQSAWKGFTQIVKGPSPYLRNASIPQGGKAWREWEEGGRTGRGKGKEE